MAEWLPDVKTKDLKEQVDIRLEHAMLTAYGKGFKDGEEQALGNIIDVECEVTES